MDAKLTTMDFAQALVRRSNIPATEASAFVRHFFETIREGLLHEKIVKVRGFGTFKLVSVDSRESVSVLDGSRIQIASHTKVTFTPDAVLRDAVNKPFAEFETVILSDELNLADFEAIDSSVTTEPSVASATLVSPVSHSSSASSSSAEAPTSVESSTPEESTPTTSITSEPSIPEELQTTETTSTSETSIPEEPQATEASSASEPSFPEEPQATETASTSESSIPEESSTSEHLYEATGKTENSDASGSPATVASATPSAQFPDSFKSSSFAFWHCFFGFLLGLLLFVAGYCVGYLRPFALPCLSESAAPAATQQSPAATKQSPAPAAQPSAPTATPPAAAAVPADSLAVPAPSQSPTSQASDAKVPSETLAYPQLEGGEYWIVGIKGTEIMKPGRTLLNFSLKYYKSKDFVPYICTMNNIKNPDVVPLNKELKIPELRKK
ncbi:MAG: HU family DNA-binding protein [Bacteroidaceae bacterium]|nr:HU family DNA-binding protein [Bacteroidaceae bacterium]